MENLQEVIKQIVEENGCQLYDIEIVEENGAKIYRIYITKPGGVTLNDCTKINNLISPLLDLEDPIEGRYFLEVSSPGLERKLTKPQHFEMSVGEQVKITKTDGEKIKGQLTHFAEGEVTISTKKGEQKVKLEDIRKAKTYIDWNNYSKLFK